MFEIWRNGEKNWIWELLMKYKVNILLVDNYQIAHHHNKVPLIPLVDQLVYVFTYSTLIYFLPKKSTSFPPNFNQTPPPPP